MNEENVIPASDLELLERTLEEVHNDSINNNTETEELENKEIPENSKTIEVDDYTSRFSGANWYYEIQSKTIIIAGCGGIGSNTVFQIARMKPDSIIIYDNDTVETGNISGQLFRKDQIGEFKVNAISSIIRDFSNYYSVRAFNELYSYNSSVSSIMICGFDNMEARRILFNNWLKYVRTIDEKDRKYCLFIDGRLSFDTIQVFAITGDDTFNIQRYSKDFLFSDKEADETICSLKQTTYLACMIASIITNNLVNFCANLAAGFNINSVPFLTEYDSNNMYLKTEI